MSECLILFWSVGYRMLPIYPVFRHHWLTVDGKHSILQP